MASGSSASAAPSVFRPTGPPWYFSMMVSNSLRSTSSKPWRSTSSMLSADWAVGDARRATGAARDFGGTGTIDAHAENLGGTLDDDAEIVVSVELEPQQQTEARAQGRGEQSGARSGADEGERLYVHGVRACGRALADHDIE